MDKLLYQKIFWSRRREKVGTQNTVKQEWAPKWGKQINYHERAERQERALVAREPRPVCGQAKSTELHRGAVEMFAEIWQWMASVSRLATGDALKISKQGRWWAKPSSGGLIWSWGFWVSRKWNESTPRVGKDLQMKRFLPLKNEENTCDLARSRSALRNEILCFDCSSQNIHLHVFL